TNIIDSEIANFDRGIVNSGFNRTGVAVDLTFTNVGEEVRLAGVGSPIEFVDRSAISDLAAPIVEISPDSDLVLDRYASPELFIQGTITDQAGTYGFATNRWVNQPSSNSAGLTVRFEQQKWLDFEEAFALHGVLQEGGGWVMPVVFWVSDRITGEPHPVVVPIEIVGFSDAELEPYRIEAVSLPTYRSVSVAETRLTSADAPVPPAPEPAPLPEPEPEPEPADPVYIARLYEAAFGRAADAEGLDFWVGEVDAGRIEQDALADVFVASDEFALLFGANPTDEDYVEALYANVLDRSPDQAGYDFWLGALASGEETRADMLEFFANSIENIEGPATPQAGAPNGGPDGFFLDEL
ncbi:MAG: DUF4214 domain-containing protein, partial [Pseudomonadota bacterium]